MRDLERAAARGELKETDLVTAYYDDLITAEQMRSLQRLQGLRGRPPAPREAPTPPPKPDMRNVRSLQEHMQTRNLKPGSRSEPPPGGGTVTPLRKPTTGEQPTTGKPTAEKPTTGEQPTTGEPTTGKAKTSIRRKPTGKPTTEKPTTGAGKASPESPTAAEGKASQAKKPTARALRDKGNSPGRFYVWDDKKNMWVKRPENPFGKEGMWNGKEWVKKSEVKLPRLQKPFPSKTLSPLPGKLKAGQALEYSARGEPMKGTVWSRGPGSGQVWVLREDGETFDLLRVGDGKLDFVLSEVSKRNL